MAMFDNVTYEGACPDCQAKNRLWWTKDGPRRLLTLQPRDVRNFYTICHNCGAHLVAEVVVANYVVRIHVVTASEFGKLSCTAPETAQHGVTETTRGTT